ncbi:MAG: hypothetical protein C0623_12690 [Desulfuromonas sp.]|nr:MAG: hypothetical protein C0623_12690 [Desulfuromonas sp.]
MTTVMRNVVAASVLVALILGGCDSNSESSVPTTEKPREKSVPVHVQTVTKNDLDERFSLPGSLEAMVDLSLAAEIAGPVDWIGPTEGSRLVKDEVILTIDSVSQKANLERALVDAEMQQANMRRLENLVAKNLVSRREYDNSVTAYETARQNLKLARIALNKSSVRAPIAGVLDKRFVERGEYVKVGDPVAVIVQVDRLKVLVDVPEKDVRSLHVGEVVDVLQTQIDTGETIKRIGKLVHLAYNADPVTRTYLAKFEVDNHDRQLRPGMIVRIEALRRTLKDAIAVPLYALIDNDGRKVVFVEEQGRAQMRPVEIGRVVRDQVVVQSGLEAGENLIIKGHQLLSDGMPVIVKGD